ncbi:MAG: aminotransferase class IV [Prolixibacteraceae bacterium]
MCRLLETIRLENGILQNIFYHNRRMNASRTELFNTSDSIQLEKEITVPEELKRGLYRCRVVYGSVIDQIEFLPLSPKNFERLKIVHDNLIDYHLKFADRSGLEKLFSLREKADEIIIVRNGLVTDCTIGNLVFDDGNGWLTPATPLLNGTQRQALLDKKLIKEAEITERNLPHFLQAGIINVFFDLKNMPRVKITDIF